MVVTAVITMCQPDELGVIAADYSCAVAGSSTVVSGTYAVYVLWILDRAVNETHYIS